MVSAWVYEETTADPRTPHQLTPNLPVPLSVLSLLGVDHWVLPTVGAIENPHAGELGTIRTARQYSSHDVVTISREKLPNYDEKLKMFFTEHLHEDEEIRFCIEGSGYFDCRSDVDHSWVRIHVEQGDLIVLPAGMYHRFTLDEADYIQVIRLFKDNPKWEAINRGERADGVDSRKVYLKHVEENKEDILKQFVQKGKHIVCGDSKDAEDRKRKHPSGHPNGERKEAAFSAPNGEGFLINENAKAIANYPHMRAYGGLLYVSGISSRRPDNTHEGAVRKADGTFDLDIKAQTRAVLNNIEAILKHAGANLTHCVSVTTYLTDMKYYPEYNQVYNEYFPDPAKGPSRTTIAVKQLPHPNLLIEIQAVAADPRFQ